jgi:alkanesulfonate monooxygenase
MRRLEFGWFLPTAGDTTAYGLASAQVAPSLPLFDKVVAAAEAAGFEYMLVPVQTACWEAWISSAMMMARSKSIRMLVAARPSYINPVLLAKMISTFDQLSGGRICINLIAGQSEAENASEGIKWGKEERYEIMDEEVSILKALWTAHGPLDFDGKFHQLKGAQIRPHPLQKPYPKFYLGGGSRRSRPSIPTCICSGATLMSASAPTWPRSGAWRPSTVARTRSASACACRSSAARPRERRGTSRTISCRTPAKRRRPS